jgi:hypothetical protein
MTHLYTNLKIKSNEEIKINKIIKITQNRI